MSNTHPQQKDDEIYLGTVDPRVTEWTTTRYGNDCLVDGSKRTPVFCNVSEVEERISTSKCPFEIAALKKMLEKRSILY